MNFWRPYRKLPVPVGPVDADRVVADQGAAGRDSLYPISSADPRTGADSIAFRPGETSFVALG